MQNVNKENSKFQYFIPGTLYELFKNMKSCKNYRLYFDDINFIDVNSENTGSADTISVKNIYPGFIEDLSVLKRSDRYFEIGAEFRVNDILKKGSNVLPSLLVRALKETGLPNLKNIYTLGGLICTPILRNRVFTVLSLLNAKVEITSSTTITAGNKKMLPVQQLFKNGSLDIQSGEMITRIRIPYEDYDVEYYKEILENDRKICFIGAASTFKNSISSCKFAIGNWGQTIIREKEIESGLMEQKIPLPEKDREIWEKQFEELFDTQYTSFSPYAQKTLTNIFIDFLKKL